MVVDVSTGRALIYIFILTLSTFAFITTFYSAMKMDGKNKKDEDGKIISINNLKHAKFCLWFVSYLFFYFTITILYELSFTYLEIEGLVNIFNWTYMTMGWIIYPLLLATVVVIIMNKIADDKIQKNITRGVGERT